MAPVKQEKGVSSPGPQAVASNSFRSAPPAAQRPERERELARRRDTREAARKKRLNIILLPRDTQSFLIRWLSPQSTQPPAGSFRGFVRCAFDICPLPAIASACKADSLAAAERRFLRVHQCP